MAQTVQEIAKDIVVAWLSHNALGFHPDHPDRLGHAISRVYKTVLQAVQDGTVPASSVPTVPLGVSR
jgi:hypothetical protein